MLNIIGIRTFSKTQDVSTASTSVLRMISNKSNKLCTVLSTMGPQHTGLHESHVGLHAPSQASRKTYALRLEFKPMHSTSSTHCAFISARMMRRRVLCTATIAIMYTLRNTTLKADITRLNFTNHDNRLPAPCDEDMCYGPRMIFR